MDIYDTKNLEGNHIYLIEQVGINVVTFYDRANYLGKSVVMNLGEYDCPKTKQIGFDKQMQSMKVPAGFKVTLYQGCYKDTSTTVASKTFEGPINVSDGGGYGGKVSSFKVEEMVGGCCQISTTDNTCFYADYLNGNCIELPKKTIGCTRGVWVERATYDATTNKCIRELTAAEAEKLAKEIEK